MRLDCNASIALSSFFWGAVAMLAFIGIVGIAAYFVALRGGGGD